MIDINLIPAQYRTARQRKRRIVTWSLVTGAYALVLVVGLGITHLVSAFEGEGLSAQMSSLNNKISQIESQDKSLRHEIVRAKTAYDQNHLIAEQPDWSILLTLVASNLGNDTVLRSLKLHPGPDASPSPSPSPASSTDQLKTPVVSGNLNGDKSRHFQLELTGFGQSQTAVSQFVLRLEQMKLFDQVQLAETRREPMLSSEVIAFRLTCWMNEPEEGHR